MLYHVPDIPKAIGEIHRVLRIGGWFWAVTNGRENMREYGEAVRQAAEFLEKSDGEAFRRLTTAVSAPFDDVIGRKLVGEVFGEVEAEVMESELVFETAEPVVKYFDSFRTLRTAEPGVYERLRRNLLRAVEERLKGGAWRMGKRMVVLSARRRGGE
jgi:SAM-dependent methyltransferase